MPKKNYQLCDRVALITLSVSVFLSIVGFIPGGLLPDGLVKGYLLLIGTLVALSAWLVGRLLEGSFQFSKTPILGSLGVLFVVFFLSAIFSHNPSLSFLGEGFEQGTFALLATFCILPFLAGTLFTTKRRLLVFLTGFFLLYVIIALFQVVHLFFPAATTLGVFLDRTSTPVGTWSDFAFLSGAATVGFVLVFEFLKPTGKMRILATVGSILGLFFVILTNVFVVWVLVGISALFILTYKLVVTRFSESRNLPFFAFALSLVALLFIIANGLIGGILAEKLHAPFVSIYPNLSATVHVAKSSLWANPVFGAGPNRFLHEWFAYHPAAVNSNTLWDFPFATGVSFFATTAILTGILGLLACLLFLAAFVYESVKKVFLTSPDPGSEKFVFSVFLLSVYFIAAIVFFSPGTSVITCAFFFVGLLIACMQQGSTTPTKTILFLNDKRTSFFSILCIIFMLMVIASVVYAATGRFAASIYFNKGIRAANAGDIEKADQRIMQAISLSDLPVFERNRAALAAQTLQKTLNTTPSSASPEAVRGVVQQIITIGNSAARQAIALDPSDPQNYLVLGNLMRLIAALKVDGAFDAAVEAYNRASTQAVHYPKPYFLLAELYFDKGDTKNARVAATKAIAEKPNYTAAFFLMAQIEIAEGNTAAAMKKLSDATMVDPSNPDTYFELGLLKYQNSDYAGAVAAFKQAVNLDNSYLNGWYFLALADTKTGATAEATEILNALHKQLPDNADITKALANVQSGKSIDQPAPATKQEKSKKLPVSDTSKNQ